MNFIALACTTFTGWFCILQPLLDFFSKWGVCLCLVDSINSMCLQKSTESVIEAVTVSKPCSIILPWMEFGILNSIRSTSLWLSMRVAPTPTPPQPSPKLKAKEFVQKACKLYHPISFEKIMAVHVIEFFFTVASTVGKRRIYRRTCIDYRKGITNLFAEWIQFPSKLFILVLQKGLNG